MDEPTPGPIITVFRSRLRPGAEANGYSQLAAEMEKRARAMPGFMDFKTFSAPDGERVSIVMFASVESQRAWRDDPEHRKAQLRGRQAFYVEYSISVCQQLRQYRFEAGLGQH